MGGLKCYASLRANLFKIKISCIKVVFSFLRESSSSKQGGLNSDFEIIMQYN